MATVTLYNLGVAGVEKDIPAHLLPPEVWSNGNNFRAQDGYQIRWLGHEAELDPPEVAPGFIMSVPTIEDDYWFYADLENVYGYLGGTHTEISRTTGGAYATEQLRDWNGTMFQGVPVLNNWIDVPQWWPVASLAQALEPVTNWDPASRAKIIRGFGRFLVALNLKEGSDLFPHGLRWSHPADPGSLPSSWDYTDSTKDAGLTFLTDAKGGEIVEGVLLGSFLVIYKERSTHLLRFVGGTEIFAPDLLFEQGLLGARCAAVIDSGSRHACIGADRLYVHSGSKNSLEYPFTRKNQRSFYADIDQDNKKNAFVFDNTPMEEAWFCYPQIGQTYPNKALVWNYRNGSQSFRDFDGLSSDIGGLADESPLTWDTITGSWDEQTLTWNQQGDRRLLVASPGSDKIWGMDTGSVFGATANRPAFLQRTGLAVVGKDRQGNPKADYQGRKLAKRIWPKVVGSDAVLNVRIGKQEEIDGSVEWASAKQYVPSQRYLDFEVNGRLLAVEFTTVNDAACRIDGYDLEIEDLGQQ